jgi:hypothetical protein
METDQRVETVTYVEVNGGTHDRIGKNGTKEPDQTLRDRKSASRIYLEKECE